MSVVTIIICILTLVCYVRSSRPEGIDTIFMTVKEFVLFLFRFFHSWRNRSGCKLVMMLPRGIVDWMYSVAVKNDSQSICVILWSSQYTEVIITCLHTWKGAYVLVTTRFPYAKKLFLDIYVFKLYYYWSKIVRCQPSCTYPSNSCWQIH